VVFNKRNQKSTVVSESGREEILEELMEKREFKGDASEAW
jgi:hypothetical protein